MPKNVEIDYLIIAQGQVNGKNNFFHFMYLSKENFTCLKDEIMHKELSLALTVLKPYKLF